MLELGAVFDEDPLLGFNAEESPTAFDEARFRAMRHQHFELVWRLVRRLGVPAADVDDATQQVFILAARKLGAIAPGSERSYLFGIALRVASHARRAVKRRAEVAADALEGHQHEAPAADDLLDQRRARELLDEVLQALPLDVRAVFILFELEQMTLVEIAALVDVPQGTAASRLRRGRELFHAEIARIKARTPRSGR
jgi:RNA polymerase sigma-70 factor, ECF subfamily